MNDIIEQSNNIINELKMINDDNIKEIEESKKAVSGLKTISKFDNLSEIVEAPADTE